MFQVKNGETINSTSKATVSFKIISTTSATRPCFTTQHQTCKTKTKTTACNTNTDFYPRDVVSAVYATATWLAGWLSGWLDVTRRYCIKTAKPILTSFEPSGSPIILVSSDPAPIPNSKGTPSAGLYIHGGGKMAIFDGNRRLSRKRCETFRWLLWNVNRKSWVLRVGLNGVIFDNLVFVSVTGFLFSAVTLLATFNNP